MSKIPKKKKSDEIIVVPTGDDEPEFDVGDEPNPVLVRREMDFWHEAIMETCLWITSKLLPRFGPSFEGSALELPGFNALA